MSDKEDVSDPFRRGEGKREIAILQTAIIEGIDSGIPTRLDMDAIKQKAKAKARLDAKKLISGIY